MYPSDRFEQPTHPIFADLYPAGSTSDVPYKYVAIAIEALADHDLDIEESDRLSLRVHLALWAMELFFAASLYEPSDYQLDEFFRNFIVSSYIADILGEAA